MITSHQDINSNFNDVITLLQGASNFKHKEFEKLQKEWVNVMVENNRCVYKKRVVDNLPFYMPELLVVWI